MWSAIAERREPPSRRSDDPRSTRAELRPVLLGARMEHCSKGRWSDECLWCDIFSLLAECCSRCCSFRMAICRNCRLPTGQIPICPSSASIPIGNGRSALFTTRASRRSSLHTSRTQIASRLRQRSPTSRPRRGRHLHNCNHPMPSSYRHPIQKSGNRLCNASVRSRKDPRRRPQSGWRSDPNLASLGEAPGEWRAHNVLNSISGLTCRRLGYPWKVHGNKMVSVPTATIHSKSRRSNSGSIAYHLCLPAKIVGWFRSVERRSVTGLGSSSAMSHRLWGASPRKGGARLLDRLPPTGKSRFQMIPTAIKPRSKGVGSR
jgi:hypothetical protein